MELFRSKRGGFLSKREKERRAKLGIQVRQLRKHSNVLEMESEDVDSVPDSENNVFETPPPPGSLIVLPDTGDARPNSDDAKMTPQILSPDQTDRKTASEVIPGRRIIDFGHLISSLSEGCSMCKKPLSLTKLAHETRRGLGSILYVDCVCGAPNRITTEKWHHSPSKNKTMPVFDINKKVAGAMIHTGMGPTHVTTFLSALEVPPLNPKTLKIHEQSLHSMFKDVADTTCRDVLDQEKRLSETLDEQVTFEEALQFVEDDQPLEPPKKGLTLQYDMGWQKRSSGRKYDSLSGVGAMIGKETGKIVAYATRQKDCRVCNIYEHQKKEIPEHICFKNYDGSSKGMEPDVAAELVKNLEVQENHVKAIIMDDDSTTIARVRQELPHEVLKYSDFMHVRKHVTSSFYALQKKHRVLSTQVIKYFTKCFSYAVNQNKGDANSLKNALKGIVPHAFGDHENCGTWCKADANYKYKSLPNGKPLNGERLKDDLNGIFENLILNAEKIAPCHSTKENESFNNIVASKAPKSRHYSSSGSFNTRVLSAVAQKNIGHSYLSQVFTSGGLSPGQFYNSHAKKRDRARVSYNTYRNAIPIKRRRLEFARQKKRHQATEEVREGTTYSSGVDLQVTDVDIETIPRPLNVPPFRPLSDINQMKVVMFDLETTSLARTCDIVQLSACFEGSGFNVYIMPDQPIFPKVSEITRLKIFNSELYHHGKKVTTLSSAAALQGFIEWLEEKNPVLLGAHNCKNFDAPRLVLHMQRHNLMKRFSEVVCGFLDTLPLFKATYKLPNYKQTTIVNHVLQEEYQAHDATEDAKVLEKVFQHTRPTFESQNVDIAKYTCSAEDIAVKAICDEEKNRNLPSLKPLLENKVAGSTVIDRMASSGLNLQHIKTAHRRGEVEGLRTIFSELNNIGKPRVTKSIAIIKKIANYLSS